MGNSSYGAGFHAGEEKTTIKILIITISSFFTGWFARMFKGKFDNIRDIDIENNVKNGTNTLNDKNINREVKI